jgi:biofilm PGA synthesis N-glycosyltransferase PgaC
MYDDLTAAPRCADDGLAPRGSSRAAAAIRQEPRRRLYLPVPTKFALVLLGSLAWAALSVYLSLPWLGGLSVVTGFWLALFVIAFIAYVPGFMNAFMVGSILADRRPLRRPVDEYPDVCVLVASYNERDNIADTLQSLARQDYAGQVRVLVIDDGSTDGSLQLARDAAAGLSRPGMRMAVLPMARNGGKSRALNAGLAVTHEPLVVTVDGDSYLRTDALRLLVERFLSDPPGTKAVAGAVLVRNSRETWLTQSQEWDYFHGIAAVKRMQSMYHGTLVAQGAFSLYDREALVEVGGWPDSVGEDIVLSWALLKAGHRIGYAEDAVLFTHVPEKFVPFAQQRRRWSRGLMEAFAAHGALLLKPRMTTLFIWWNVMFLPLDLVYTFAFIPGIVLALFGHYYIVGIMTLAVLPLAMLWNLFIYRVQSRMFARQELNVRRNLGGFLFYMLGYSLVMQPVCVWGYFSEFIGLRKKWGTK